MEQLICLDVGCGANKQSGFLGMDKRPLPGVDFIHDAEVFPWPLEDESCGVVVMSHFVEHVKPWLQIDLMNESWRVLAPGKDLMIVTPYGGSPRYFQDPTHCAPWTEVTCDYFNFQAALHKIYNPKPFAMVHLQWSPVGDLVVRYRKVATDE